LRSSHLLASATQLFSNKIESPTKKAGFELLRLRQRARRLEGPGSTRRRSCPAYRSEPIAVHVTRTGNSPPSRVLAR
jgi:hypothetical protein